MNINFFVLVEKGLWEERKKNKGVTEERKKKKDGRDTLCDGGDLD